MSELYLGALTGTSMNSFDAALFDFQPDRPELIARHAAPFPPTLQDKLHHLIVNPHPLREYALAEHALSRCLAQCIRDLLATAARPPAQIRAAGVHGQTLLHQTEGEPALTLQLLDPNLVSAQCGLPVVSDFRRRDVAEGGEGAPLAPLVHELLFRTGAEHRAIVNLGGIANLTLLPPDGPVHGFDSGPGGGLLDEWCRLHRDQDFDRDGQWARTGTVQDGLLEAMLADPYFARPPPKSTSREYFNRPWVESLIAEHPAGPADVQATLAELTARSIALALRHADAPCQRVLLCGGGARNTYLTERLAALTALPVAATDAYGMEAEWVECCLFALLARRHRQGAATDLTGITGSRKAAVLGAAWPA